MEELDNHILEAITQLRSNKKQPNESTIITHLLEELEGLNIDKKRLTERLKWLAEYKRLENKPHNGVNSYYNISDDSQRTEPPLAPHSLDKPTLDKCPNKELEVTINNDTENTIHKLNLQIQDITTKLEAIKMFVKQQFYLIKKSITEIDNQSEPQRNKEFIELLQQQNKNLVEENKSKTIIIQMLIKNQKHLHLELNSTKKFEIVTRKSNRKQSIHKTDEIKCSNRYETLYRDDNGDESCNSYDSSTSSDGSTSSDKISAEIPSGNIQKKKNRKISMKMKEMKRKDKNTVIKEKDKTSKERTGNLDIHKNRYYHQPRAPVERIQSTFSSAISRKRKKIVLFRDSILKNLRMGEFNSSIKKGEVSLKTFPGAKVRQLNHHTTPLLEDNTYDAAVIHVGINDLLSNVKSTNYICKDIIDIGLRCRNNNIGMIFISSIAYSSKVNPSLLQQLNGLLFDECRRNGFKFVDNGAVSEIDLWTDDIHIIKSGKRIIVNNLINSLNYFLEFMNPVSCYLYVKIPFRLQKLALVI